MVTLADLNPTTTAKPSLQDFGPWVAGQPTPSVVNDATASNLAAHGAVLAPPDGVIAAYNNINSELKVNSSSFTLDQLLKQRENIDHQATYTELQRVLADPNVSFDDKASYMNGYIGLTTDRPGHPSLGVTVAKQAAISPSSSNETDEAVQTIVPSDGSIYDSVDTYNGWVQKQINAMTNSKDNNWFTTAASVVESMIPFVDQLRSAKTSAGLGKINNAGDLGRAMVLLGDSRTQIRDSIASLPVDKRYELAKKVIELVQSSKGPIFNQMDTLDKVNQLNAYLNGTGYNDSAKVTDNIFSILDATIILTPFLKLGKGAIDSVKAASALKRAALVSDRTVVAAEPEVTKVIKNLQLTYDKPSGPTIFVNKKAEASADLGSVESPSQDVVDSTAELISKRILEKFNKTDPNATFYPGENPKINMVNIHDDLMASIKQVLTPSTFNDPDIVKKVNENASKLLQSRSIAVPKTFKATSSQLVKQVMDESNVSRLATRTTVAPASVSQTVKNFNPDKARAINQMMVDDESGQVAKALYGTTKTEAVANDYLPEVANLDESVRNKVNMEAPSPDATVIKRYKEDRGRIDLTTGEKSSMRTAVKQDFQDVVGMVPRTSMGTVGDSGVLVKEGSVDKPTGIHFDMVYGPKDGEFKSRKQALEQALFSLRKYGVTENEVEILGKTPEGNFIPAGIKDKFSSYLVRVKHDYEFTPADTVEHTLLTNSNWKLFDTRESWTDGRMGSLSQHFVPASSVVNKVIFNSSSVAADKSAWYSKQLFDLAGSFGKKFNALDKRQQALVDAYRIEANDKGLKFNFSNLKARGLSDDAISALTDWKKTTDTLWWLENVDANKTARARGYWRFVDQTNDTDLMVKPLPNRGFGNGAYVYDSTKGKIVELKKAYIDELYARGGNISQTRNTVELGDETFDYILVQNRSESSYIRRIRDEDNTLPYRDGYYPIKYTDTYFLERQLTRPDGTVFKKAIATAGTLKDAQRLYDRLTAVDNKAIVTIRNDYKMGTESFDEANWSYLNSSGRSSQRVRGKRLEDAAQITDPDHVNIESPEESLIHAIRSTASRTAFRDWIDTTKNRWLAQYGHLIEDQKGIKMWPEDVRVIGRDKLQASNIEVKDAKATWRHVRAMEAGYVNLLDDASKNFFKEFSNIAGRKGWGWLEKQGLKGAKVNPSSWARRKAFRLLLAANPVRQVTVQASQALPVLLATNPLAIPKIAAQNILLNYLKTGGDVDSWFKVMAKMATGLTPKEAAKMYEDYERSGFEAAVDANSLIRNQLNNIVDRSVAGKVKTLAAKPLNVTQKYGFNAGENFLMRTVWLSEYDRLKKTGVKIDAEALDNLNARVRNLTLNMNKAGELPYNENVFSAALQFFQAPHKAFSQIVLGHTGLTAADRLRLGAAYVTTFGIGGGPVSSILSNWLPDDNNGVFDTKDLIEGGVFNLGLNAALSAIFGKTVRTDFSDSFRLIADPIKPVFALWNGLMTGTVSELLTSGASVGLVFGDSPRVTNFVKQMLRVFTVDDSQKAEEFAQTGKAFLQMFSGASNFFKAKYALEWQKSINTRGGIIDYHVNDIEAILKGAGFSTIDEIHQYASNDAVYQATGKFKDDIALVVDETSKRLANGGLSQEEGDWYLRMMSEAQRVFQNNPIYMKEFSNQIIYKARNGENSIFNRLLQASGYTTPDQFTSLVNGSHLDDKYKKILLDSKAQFDQIIEENKDNQ